MYGLSALLLVTPFDASLVIGHTTATIPKAVLLSICVALALGGNIKIRDLRTAPVFLSASCVVIVTAATIVQASYADAVIRETLKAVLYLLTLCVAYWCYRSDPDSDLLTRAVCTVTGVVALAALAQEWTGAPSVFLSEHGIVPRIAGPLEGPNQLAGFLDIALSWILTQAMFARDVRHRIMPCTLAVGYLALFLTFSRGGIIATTVTALTVIAVAKAFLSPPAVVWLCFSALGLLIDIALARGGTHLFSLNDSGDTGALGHRSDLWRAAIFFWRQHPLLGIGAGNYERELAVAGYPKLHDHANSLYLQSLAEGGLLLFSAVLGLFVTIARTFLRSCLRSPLTAGALAATSAFALHQSVDFLVFYPKVATLWWIIIGVALADHLGAGDPVSKEAG